MTRTISLLSILCLGACLGGESGTPTPAIPDPGCSVVPGSTAIDDWSVAESVFGPSQGTWVGECGGRRLEISVPVFTADNASGTRDPNEWLAYGDTDVPPRACRASYRVYFGATVVLGEDTEQYAAQAVHGRYVPTFDGMPADVDRYAHAWTELTGALLVDGRPEEYSEPPTRPSEISIAYDAMLSEDETELRGTLQWYGHPADEPPLVMVPDDGDGMPGTEPFNPGGQGPYAAPLTVIDSCEFTLRSE